MDPLGTGGRSLGIHEGHYRNHHVKVNQVAAYVFFLLFPALLFFLLSFLQ
jgi:hypothetical protein